MRLTLFSSLASVSYVVLNAEFELQGLHVNPELRGEGIGHFMLSSYITLCRKTGLVPKTKRIDKISVSALLDKMGWIPTNGHRIRYKIEEDKTMVSGDHKLKSAYSARKMKWEGVEWGEFEGGRETVFGAEWNWDGDCVPGDDCTWYL